MNKEEQLDFLQYMKDNNKTAEEMINEFIEEKKKPLVLKKGDWVVYDVKQVRVTSVNKKNKTANVKDEGGILYKRVGWENLILTLKEQSTEVDSIHTIKKEKQRGKSVDVNYGKKVPLNKFANTFMDNMEDHTDDIEMDKRILNTISQRNNRKTTVTIKCITCHKEEVISTILARKGYECNDCIVGKK